MELKSDKQNIFLETRYGMATYRFFTYRENEVIMRQKQSAAWIWPGNPGIGLINRWAQFRHTFTIDAVPETCLVSISADKSYRLFINGTWVIDGPCRGFADNWFFDTVDIASFLHAGDNVIAAVAHNPGTGNHQYIHAGYAGFLLEGSVGSVDISSSKEWSRREAPEYIQYQTRLSIQLGWQEFFDAQLGDGDWTQLAYDARDWEPCSFFGARPKGSPPWHNLQERDIPLLRTEIICPTLLVSTARHTVSRSWQDNINIVTAFRIDVPSCTLVNTTTPVLTILPQTHDEVQVYVLDFQREVCASLLLAIDAARGGEHIDLIMIEGITNGLPDIHELEGCNTALAHKYMCTHGQQQHETFSPLGGRALAIAVRGQTDGFQLTITARHREYPFDIHGSITVANTRFQDIYDMCVHTQQLCAIDTYIDCPGREQAMWWGDIVTHFGNSTLFAADDRLLIRGMHLIAQQQIPNGLTYALAPTEAHECVLPDFTLAWIRSFKMLYHYNNSTDMVQRYRDAIMRAFEYFFDRSRETGLLTFDERYWLFLDWAETFKDGTPTLYNLDYLETLMSAYDVFTAAGLLDDAKICLQHADALRHKIEISLWNENTREPYDGIDQDGQPVLRECLHTFIRCISLDIHPEEHQRWAQEHLLPFINDKRPLGTELQTSSTALTPYFLNFGFQALDKLGYGLNVLSCIERWWGDMLDRGLVTTEEVWDAKAGNESTCHAWSAHPIQHITRILLGIRQISAGWKHIHVTPAYSIYPSAQGSVDTPFGPITIQWRTEENTVHGSLALPDGISATVFLASQVPQTVTGHTTFTL